MSKSAQSEAGRVWGLAGWLANDGGEVVAGSGLFVGRADAGEPNEWGEVGGELWRVWGGFVAGLTLESLTSGAKSGRGNFGAGAKSGRVRGYSWGGLTLGRANAGAGKFWGWGWRWFGAMWGGASLGWQTKFFLTIIKAGRGLKI